MDERMYSFFIISKFQNIMADTANLEEILKELKGQFTELKLEIQDNTIKAIFENVAFGVLLEDRTPNFNALQSCMRIQTFYNNEDKMIDAGHLGEYAVVLSDLKILIFPTEPQALDYADRIENALVQMIGDDILR
jgi:hypothetical protein